MPRKDAGGMFQSGVEGMGDPRPETGVGIDGPGVAFPEGFERGHRGFGILAHRLAGRTTRGDGG
jgi:hypothetical protein